MFKPIMRAILAFVFCLLCVTSQAATIVCTNLVDSRGTNYSASTAKFTPISKIPQQYGSNTVVPAVVTASIVNSSFSIGIVAGGIYWFETLPPNSYVTPVKVLVPSNDTNTYDLNQVIAFATNANVFLWTNQFPIVAGDNITFSTNGSLIVISTTGNTNALTSGQQATLNAAITNATGVNGANASIVGHLLTISNYNPFISQNVTNIQFLNNSTNVPAHSEGLVYYDNATHTLAYYNDQPDVTVNIGQEQHVRVVNKTGITITNGQVVTISGAQGNRPKAVLAVSNTNTTSTGYAFIGVATHNITNNLEGLVTTYGVVNGIDTRGYTAGQGLFVGTNAGTITTNAPNDSLSVMKVGIALNSTVNGSILVIPQDAIHLNDVTGLTNQLASYAYATNGFIRFATLDSYTLSQLGGQDGILVTNQDGTFRIGALNQDVPVNASEFIADNSITTPSLTLNGVTRTSWPSGTAYTNTTDSAGVATAYGIGTNLTQYAGTNLVFVTSNGLVARLVATNNALVSAYSNADIVTSNGLVTRLVATNNALVSSYTTADTSLSNSLYASILTNTITLSQVTNVANSLDTITSNGLVARIIATNNSLISSYTSADTVSSNGLVVRLIATNDALIASYTDADTISSNGLVTRLVATNNALIASYSSADTTTSNGLVNRIVATNNAITVAYTNADFVTSNGLMTQIRNATNDIVIVNTFTNNTAQAGVVSGFGIGTNLTRYVTTNTLNSTSNSLMGQLFAVTNNFVLLNESREVTFSNSLTFSGGSAGITLPDRPDSASVLIVGTDGSVQDSNVGFTNVQLKTSMPQNILTNNYAGAAKLLGSAELGGSTAKVIVTNSLVSVTTPKLAFDFGSTVVPFLEKDASGNFVVNLTDSANGMVVSNGDFTVGIGQGMWLGGEYRSTWPSGTTYTNNTGAAGVISGSGIGTNLTAYAYATNLPSVSAGANVTITTNVTGGRTNYSIAASSSGFSGSYGGTATFSGLTSTNTLTLGNPFSWAASGGFHSDTVGIKIFNTNSVAGSDVPHIFMASVAATNNINEIYIENQTNGIGSGRHASGTWGIDTNGTMFTTHRRFTDNNVIFRWCDNNSAYPHPDLMSSTNGNLWISGSYYGDGSHLTGISGGSGFSGSYGGTATFGGLVSTNALTLGNPYSWAASGGFSASTVGIKVYNTNALNASDVPHIFMASIAATNNINEIYIENQTNGAGSGRHASGTWGIDTNGTMFTTHRRFTDNKVIFRWCDNNSAYPHLDLAASTNGDWWISGTNFANRFVGKFSGDGSAITNLPSATSDYVDISNDVTVGETWTNTTSVRVCVQVKIAAIPDGSNDSGLNVNVYNSSAVLKFNSTYSVGATADYSFGQLTFYLNPNYYFSFAQVNGSAAAEINSIFYIAQ